MSEINDALGNRMKSYENVESKRRLNQELPIIIRLDGRGFSKFTKGMNRPFDSKMIALMQETTKFLVEETGAALGYTQSDEISLVILTPEGSQSYFDGRIQKICSVLASVCSVYFNSRLPDFFPEKVKLFPVFDCRVFNVPSLWEAGNTILWRELDASRNSIQMAARTMFSHKTLQDLNGKQMCEMMLKEKGIDWNDYPNDFKRGSYFQKLIVESSFTQEELKNLSEKHEARRNPDLVIRRSVLYKVDFPRLLDIENLPDVLFYGSDPVFKGETNGTRN